MICSPHNLCQWHWRPFGKWSIWYQSSMNFPTLVCVLGPMWAVSWDINKHKGLLQLIPYGLHPISALSCFSHKQQETEPTNTHTDTRTHTHALHRRETKYPIVPKPWPLSSTSAGVSLAPDGVEWWMGRREGWKPSSQFILEEPKEDWGLRKPTVSLMLLILKALNIFPHLPDSILHPWKEQSVCWFFAVCFKHSQSMWILPLPRKPAGSSYLITALVSAN